MWATYVVIVECIEVIIIVTLIILPQVRVYIEIAYIVTPFTSQVTSMGDDVLRFSRDSGP
jgi:hypothetical protein